MSRGLHSDQPAPRQQSWPTQPWAPHHAKETSGLTKDSPAIFRLLPSNCLNWIIYCDDHSSLSSKTTVQIWISYIHFTSFHCMGRYELKKLNSLPMWGFTDQLVKHRTGITEVTGSNPVDIFRLLLSNCLNWKIYCDDHSSQSLLKGLMTGGSHSPWQQLPDPKVPASYSRKTITIRT